MSIINRMLKDLENKPVSGDIAPVYRPSAKRIPGWFWPMLLLLPLTLWLWWQPLQQRLHQTGRQVPAAERSPERPASPPVAVNKPEVTTPVAANPSATSSVQTNQSAVSAANSAAAQIASTGKEIPRAQVQHEPTPVAQSVQTDANPATEQTGAEQNIANEQNQNVEADAEQDGTADVAGAAEAESATVPQDNSQSYTAEPANEMVVEEQKLSAGEIAVLERRKYQQAMQRRDNEAAQQALQQVLANDPLDLTSRKQLAALYYGENKLDAALSVAQQGLAMSPSSAELRLLAARISQAKGDSSHALSFLQGISPSANQNMDFYALRAALAQQNGQFRDAVFSYRALTQAEPFTGRWWLGLAISLEQSGDKTQAAQAYRRALLDSKMSAASRQFAQQRLQLPEH